MKVSDILRVKGGTLFTVPPEAPLAEAVATMAGKDIGSLVVMDRGTLAGMLTFREIIKLLERSGGQLGGSDVRSAMNPQPATCGMDTELDDIRRTMLERHARYIPVVEENMLMGVISFYDVARAVVESQDFENRMLKAYIRDWPAEDESHDR